MQNKPQVFLSYAHSDIELVRKIYRRLENSGLKPWMDEVDILGGQKWEQEIKRAIQNSQFFLFCITHNSIERRGVLQKEIKTALDFLEEKLEEDICFIPVFIDTGKISDSEIPQNLKIFQWINLTDTNGWQKLEKTFEFQMRKLGYEESGLTFSLKQELKAEEFARADFFCRNLRDAINKLDINKLLSNYKQLLEHVRNTDLLFPGNVALKMLKYFYNTGLFLLGGELADSFLIAGLRTFGIRKYYALFLADRGFLSASLNIIEDLRKISGIDYSEEVEIIGYFGNLNARIFFNAEQKSASATRNSLLNAINAYLEIYNRDKKKHLFFGSRAATLLTIAQQENIGSYNIKASEIAEAILFELEDRKDFEDLFIANDRIAYIISALLMERSERLVEEVEFLVSQKIGVSLPDLVELNQDVKYIKLIKNSLEPEDSIIAILNKEILALQDPWKKIGNSKPGQASQISYSENLEKVFEEKKYNSFNWYIKGRDRCTFVAKIGKTKQKGFASGFILKGNTLHYSLGEEFVLVTATHVVSNDQDLNKWSHKPEELIVTFEVLDKDKEFRCKEIIWYSPMADLDVTVLKFTEDDQILISALIGESPVYTISDRLTPLILGNSESVYLIGHPYGGQLQLSLESSLLLDYDDKIVHYKASTNPGSSGSPVFDKDWNLIGMHHARSTRLRKVNGKSGTYEACEGILMKAVVDQINKSFLE